MKYFYTRTLAHISLLSLCALTILLGVDTAFAADTPTYTPLVGIPGLTDANNTTLPSYLNNIYTLIVTIGALFGVVKIAFAGVKYSVSEVITDKKDARNDIKNVLLGLGVLLIPFMVLNTINPELTRLDVLHEAKKLDLGKSSNGNTPSIVNNTNQTQIDECSKKSDSWWDHTCNKCVLKTQAQGEVCGKQTITTGKSCSGYSYNSYLPDCKSVCASLRGEYSEANQTCTVSGVKTQVKSCAGTVWGYGTGGEPVYDTTACYAECSALGGTVRDMESKTECTYTPKS